MLVSILEDDITVNSVRSRASTGGNTPISKKLITCMSLRFMGGTKHKDLDDVHGVSTKSAKRLLNRFLWSVDTSESSLLSIDFLPRSTEEKKQRQMNGFHVVLPLESHMGIYVFLMDGYVPQKCLETCPIP